jgi:hypothetical protein
MREVFTISRGGGSPLGEIPPGFRQEAEVEEVWGKPKD